MFDAYIRVSSTKGRSGESFISPDVQRDTIERLAKAKGVEIGETVERSFDAPATTQKVLTDRDPELGRYRAIFRPGTLDEAFVVVGIDEGGDADSLGMHVEKIPSR